MKTKAYVILSIFLVALASIAAAYEQTDNETETINETIENQTLEEAEAFSSNLGARIRLLQLEYSITKNILSGEAIIAAIKEKNSSTDTTELEAIIAQLKILRDEVKAATPEAGEEAAQQFVDLKGDAIELTQKFRKIVHTILNPSDIKELKRKLQAIRWNETKNLVERIHEIQREYNTEKVSEAFSALGINNTKLIESVRNGEATIRDIRDAIREATANMSKEEKKQAYNMLREKVIKRNVFLTAVAEKVRNRQIQRLRERIQNRLQIIEQMNISAKVRTRLRERLMEAENKSQKIENRFQLRIERIEQITAKRIDKIERLINKRENRSQRIQERLEEMLQGNQSQKNKAQGGNSNKGGGPQ